MKRFLIIFVSILSLFVGRNPVDTSRILAVVPFGAKSHYAMLEPLLIELSKRGHNVTAITAFPQKKPVPNFTDIDISKHIVKFVSGINMQEFDHIPIDPFLNIVFLADINITGVFDVHEVNALINSENVHFDLVINELFNNDVFLGFVNKFNAPSIAFSSSPLMSWANQRFGNPDNPSYIPDILSNLNRKMTFLQRTYNLFLSVFGKLAYDWYFNYVSEGIAKKHFGDDIPPLPEIAKNTSLIFVNTHRSLHGARPLVPAVIEVGGMHVRPPQKLSPVKLFHIIYLFILLKIFNVR